MINVYTLTNNNTKVIEGKLSKIFISEQVCIKLVALRSNRYTKCSSQLKNEIVAFYLRGNFSA